MENIANGIGQENFQKHINGSLKKKTSGLSEDEKPVFNIYFDGSRLIISGDHIVTGSSFMLFDSEGKLVTKSLIGQDKSIDISGLSLAPGVYIVRLWDQTVKVFLYH